MAILPDGRSLLPEGWQIRGDEHGNIIAVRGGQSVILWDRASFQRICAQVLSVEQQCH